MIRYYFNRFSIVLLFAMMLFSSCLENNTVSETEYSADAQIYALNAKANNDSTNVLKNTPFSINQIQNQIFNKDSLSYGFVPSNAKLSITTKNASGIKIHLSNPDSSYLWNNTDSVALNRLSQIEVFAQDQSTTKKYFFTLNIHQIDPDSIVWKKVTENYISEAVSDQKTVMFDDKFFTYFKADGVLKVASSNISDAKNWSIQTLSGVPANFLLASLATNENKLYLLDTSGKLYVSSDGLSWSYMPTEKLIKAIYGKLPSNTTDSLLTVVVDGNELKFAKTSDFSTLHIINDIPQGFPVSDFSATSIQKTDIYASKFIAIAGGKTKDNVEVNHTWLVKDGEEAISAAASENTGKISMKDVSLFTYDDNLYLLTSEVEKNTFFISQNYGISWQYANAKQQLPLLTEFAFRRNQSLIVDDKNTIWIFGGISNTNIPKQLIEVWKGRLNKLIVNE